MRRGEADRYSAVRRRARVLSMSFISDGARCLCRCRLLANTTPTRPNPGQALQSQTVSGAVDVLGKNCIAL